MCSAETVHVIMIPKLVQKKKNWHFIQISLFFIEAE